MRIGTIILFAMIAIIATADIALAQTGETIEGEITRVNRAERTVTVRSDSDGKTYRYMIPRGVRITVEGRSAEFRDLRRGDGVMLAFAAPEQQAPPVVTRVRVPETPIDLDERREDPPEAIPTMLPATASILPALYLLAFGAFGGGLLVRRLRRAL